MSSTEIVTGQLTDIRHELANCAEQVGRIALANDEINTIIKLETKVNADGSRLLSPEQSERVFHFVSMIYNAAKRAVP